MHRRLHLQWLAQVVVAVEVEAELPVVEVVVDAVVQLPKLAAPVLAAEAGHPVELPVVEPPAAVAVVVPLLKVLLQQVPAVVPERPVEHPEALAVAVAAVVRRLLRLDHVRLPTECL